MTYKIRTVMILDIDFGGVHPEDRLLSDVLIACMPLCEEGDCEEIGVLWVLIPSYTWQGRLGAVPIAERNVPLCTTHFCEFMWH